MSQLVKTKRQANFKDLKPLRGSSNKKTFTTRSCVNWAFFGTRGPLKRSFHSRLIMAHFYYYYYYLLCVTNGLIGSLRRGIWREHSSKKWIRPRFSVDLIKGLQMSRAKPKLRQIFHLSSGVPLTFFWGQFL
jgi:hypothetical protein